MSKKEKKLSRWISIWFAVISLPILVLSFYNVPSADDYTFGRLVKAYVSEHGYNVPGILRCGIQNSINYYFSWQGRYSESFFASFMPDIFGCYWIWTIILYALFTGGVVFLFRTLVKYLAGEEYLAWGTGVGLLAGTAVVQNVPYPVEAFYWFDGSMAYMFHHSIYLWMCGLAVRYFFTKDRKETIRCMIPLAVLTVLAAGGNNVTSFISILTYCIFVGAAVLIRRKWGILFPFALSILGFAVSYLSPGTTIRGGDSSNYTPILLTIRKCFVWTIKQYLIRWTTLGILVMLLLLTPVLIRLMTQVVEKYHFRFPFPLLVLIGDVCFLSAMSCPSFYVLGEPGPGRLKNVIYVNFVIIVILTYAYLAGWAAERFGKSRVVRKISGFYENMPGVAGTVCTLVAFVLLCAGNFQQCGTSVEAVKELVSGQASQYYTEAMDRKEMYLDSSLREVEVSPYSVKPYLLYFDDITDEPENWKNIGLSEFYGKDSVKLDKYDPDVDYD